jgi:hypothetical protein
VTFSFSLQQTVKHLARPAATPDLPSFTRIKRLLGFGVNQAIWREPVRKKRQ